MRPHPYIAVLLLITGCGVTAGPHDAPELIPWDSGTEDDAPRLAAAGAGPELTLISDTPCVDPCTFRAGGSTSPAKVVYAADDWVIGESTDPTGRFPVTYDFQSLGDRFVTATAFDPHGQVIGTAGAWIEVLDGTAEEDAGTTPELDEPALPDVPYFYQYANEIYPSSTCQNTVIAMALAWVGWDGDPDVITAYWGKDRAQSPAGFADVLTREAAYWGLDLSATATTDGTLDGLRALLDEGLPVPVHGYFTSYGHVVMVLGYDADGYWVNDPAGRWAETFMGGYPGGWEPTVGEGIYYPKAPFEAAIATSNGTTPLPLWYHQLHP